MPSAVSGAQTFDLNLVSTVTSSIVRSLIDYDCFLVVSLTCIQQDTLGDLVKPYQFGYQIKDKDGNVQHRHEESDAEGVKRGSYGYVDANGVYRKVFYVADKNGFRIKEMKSNEPGFDAKVAAAMKETSNIKTPVDSITSTASAHYSSSPSVNQLSPSLLSSDSGNYNPSKVTSTDREFNNQRVKASFNLNTSESKKDASKAKHSNVYQSIANKVKSNHSHNHHHNHHHNHDNNNKVISHSSLPETVLRPPYTETYSTSSDGLINNPSYSRDIALSGDTRREFTHEPYVYYAQPSVTVDNGHVSLPLMPVRSIDTTFPYKFVSPRGIYNNNGDSNSVSSGNPLQSSHSMPIYSSVSSSSSPGKHMSPYLQALPIHTYRAPVTNTSSSNYGVNYASNSPPKTVYIPVYPPIMSHNDHHSYGNDVSTYAPTTPHYGPFESTRLRPPEPTSSTTLGYMHPLQPVRSATTPAYSSPPSDKYHHHHHHNYNSPPIDNSIDRPSDHVKHHHRHPIDHPYSPQYNSHSPHHPHSSSNYPPYQAFNGPPSPPSSSPSHERPLQYLDGPGPGSMIGSNRMQPTVFYVDGENDDHLVKKQHSVDPTGYDDVPAPHRTGHDPTPHGFESPFIDVPPTAPPVPPPEADNNQPPPPGVGPPGSPGGHHHHHHPSAGSNNGHSQHDHPLPGHHPHHHHHSSPDHLSGYPSPPTPPGHPSNPYYNPYNPYASNNMITDPARARLASYYQAVRQAAPPSSASSALSVSPSTSSSPSTLNVPSVLLGIQSAQGLEVATSLGALSDTDANYNPSHYPTPDQLNKWKARAKSSSYRRNRNRNSILNIDDDSDDDSVITSSSNVDLQRIKLINSTHSQNESKTNNITASRMFPLHHQSTNNESSNSSTVLSKLPTWFGGLR